MVVEGDIPTPPRSNGLATILAVGTANPPNAIYNSDYPDFYFRVTNSEHMTDLKEKFKRLCEKSEIKKRYMHLNEEILKQNPDMCVNGASSLDARHAILATEIPRLGKEAAIKAIEEWGQPKYKITHLIFCTTSPIDVPGPDYHLTMLLGLNPSVKRYMLPQQGCHAGGAAFRLAKDLAENNHGARVLIVCSESSVMYFSGPIETDRTTMLSQAIFADGAGAAIVGANPDESLGERPIFELVSSSQTILPNSQGALGLEVREMGVTMRITMSPKELISNNINKVLVETFSPVGINDWNSIFWISHPGSAQIVGQIESKLGLNETKLSTARHVLSEFGHMTCATVLFVMDEMRKRSLKEGKATTGDGFDWGVLFGFGPGFTVDTLLLRSFPLSYKNL